MKIICVIPAYNEDQHLAGVIAKVRPLVDAVVVVDDGSQKKITGLAELAGVFVLRHPINRGQGAALQTGSDYALKLGADIIIHFDGDDQFEAAEIPEVIAPLLSQEADVVFGSRFLEKKSNIPKVKKYIVMPLGRFLNRLWGVRTSDPQSGFRAYTREVAQSFRIENDRMAHCSEILIKLSQAKWRIKEIPVTVTYHEYGQKLNGGFRIIKDLFLQKIRQ
ncbi:MAG TPA: glycosyltransferase family 2 protein [bacterium]|jgi:glycosyltransferase involved in cell wall biosynthesis|nr:glycosyltransferase family 2 protein [bacterium]